MITVFSRATFRTGLSSVAPIALTLMILGLVAAGHPTQSSAQTPTGTSSPANRTPSSPTMAQANLIDEAGQSIGSVLFGHFPENPVAVRVSVSGLSPGWHGFHVHDVGTCEAPSFTTSGGHYNPGDSNHGHHAGDMPPLYVRRDGLAWLAFTTDRFSVDELLAADVAVVIHASPDNLAHITDQDIVNPDGSYSQRAYYYKPDPAANNFVAGPALDTTLRTGDAGARRACGPVRPTTGPFPERTTPIVGADAVLLSESGSNRGRVTFAGEGSGAEVQVSAFGLSPGWHGVHVHDVGSCAPSFASAGGHYNPTNSSHAHHAGDMPPLLVKQDGTGSATFTSDRFSVGELLGADVAVVIHENPDNLAHIPAQDIVNPDGSYAQRSYYYKPDPAVDNFVAGPAPDTTLLTGDAGARVACGPVRSFSHTPMTPHPPRRTVSLETSTHRARFGRPFQLTAQLVAEFQDPECIAGVEVVLSRTIAGRTRHVEVGRSTTDASGAATFVRLADGSATYTASVAQTTFCSGAVSEGEVVLVRKIVTLRRRPGPVPAGARIGMTIRVEPCAGHRGDDVVLLRAFDGRLIRNGVRPTDHDCRVGFERTIRRRTVFQARSPRQDADHEAGRSRREVVAIR